MAVLTQKATISRAPAVVWAHLENVERTPEWIRGVNRATRLDTAPPHVGMTIRETRTFGAKEEKYEVKVTHLEAPKRFQRTVHHGGHNFVYTFELAPNGRFTDVALTMESKPVGLVGVLRVGWGNSMLKKHDADMLDRLKEDIEKPRMDRSNAPAAAALV